MKPIHVFLRHCYYSKLQELPGRKRPIWFNKENVFKNFKNTINPELADYTIVYDEHFGKIEDTFLKDEKNVEIINCGNESFSFISTIDIIRSKNFSDDKIIYFLEDDYLHKPDWESIAIEGIGISDYVSLCDHAVNYNEEKNTEVFYTKSIHWKKIFGCTNSFLVKYKTLKEDLKYHVDYSKKYFFGYEELPSSDYSKAIGNCIEEPFYNFLYSDDYKKFNKLSERRKIISSLPGYSCHCEHRDIVFENVWKSYLNCEIKNSFTY